MPVFYAQKYSESTEIGVGVLIAMSYFGELLFTPLVGAYTD